MNRLKQVVSYIPFAGLLVIYGCLFFQYSIVEQTALIITGIGYFADYMLNERWKTWHFTPDKWPWVACIVLFALFPLWIAFGIETGPEQHDYLESFLPFLIFGIIGLMGMNDKLYVEGFALVGLTLVSAASLYLFTHSDMQQTVHMLHIMENPFNTLRNKLFPPHMQFNLFANMSLVFAYMSLRQKRVPRIVKIILAIEAVITILTVYISEGRTGLLTMAMLLVFMICYQLFKLRHLYAYIFAVVGTIACCAIGFKAVQVHHIPFEYEPRHFLWKIAVHQIKDEPILGYGPSSGHEQFVERCRQDENIRIYYLPTLCSDKPGQEDYYIRMAHPHNLFLEIGIDYGIIGVIVMLFILLGPILFAPPHRHFYAFLCVFVFLMQAMFERLGNNLNPMVLFIALLLTLSPLEDVATQASGTQSMGNGRNK